MGNLASITGDKYINGTELAKHLGIGRTTLNRWIREGKLPKPVKSTSVMLIFNRHEVGLIIA